MLGSSPRHSLQNRFAPGRLWPPQSHEIAQFPCSRGEKPVLQPSHKIVIGFELGGAPGDGSLHMQASESPRSVLDPERPQSASPRSPLSALGSLFTGRSCDTNTDLDSEKLASIELSTEDVISNELMVDAIGSDALVLLKNNRFLVENGRRNAVQRERYTHLCCSSVRNDEAECTENEIQLSKCIFSAGSPTLRHSLHREQGANFLSKCFRCRRKLLGKDIYMYRGDQAFCSQDCRNQQIVAGERKHRGPVVSPCVSRASLGVGGMGRVTQLAFA